jgi:hypothetical protein
MFPGVSAIGTLCLNHAANSTTFAPIRRKNFRTGPKTHFELQETESTDCF